MQKDYYKTLGIEKGANADEIKKAFRKKAHQHHPDKANGDAEKFKEVSEAYQVLSDEKKRGQYDQFGTVFDGAAAGGGFNWQDFAGAAGGAGGTGFEFDLGDLGDMFGDIFGVSRGGRAKRTQAGRDLRARLEIDFSDAAFGVQKGIELDRLAPCDACKGEGADAASGFEDCSACQGRGRVEKLARTMFGTFRQPVACSACQGQGRRAKKECADCQGQGRRRASKKIKVSVPAGIDDGQSIKLAGMGEAGAKGARAGDLYVEISVRRDPAFERAGDDVRTAHQVSFSQAALGDRVQIATLDGDISLKIPAGTQSGQVFKIRGKGMGRLGRTGRGDHLVEVAVYTPKRLSRKQRKLLEEFNELES